MIVTMSMLFSFKLAYLNLMKFVSHSDEPDLPLVTDDESEDQNYLFNRGAEPLLKEESGMVEVDVEIEDEDEKLKSWF